MWPELQTFLRSYKSYFEMKYYEFEKKKQNTLNLLGLNQECPWVPSGWLPMVFPKHIQPYSFVFQQTYKVSTIIHILYMRKLRVIEIKELAGFTQLINDRGSIETLCWISKPRVFFCFILPLSKCILIQVLWYTIISKSLLLRHIS